MLNQHTTFNRLGLIALALLLFCPFFTFGAKQTTISSLITGPISVCEGNAELYTTPYTSGYTYNWGVTGGSGTSSINIGTGTSDFAVNWGSTTGSPGSITLVIYNGLTLVDSSTVAVTIVGPPEPEITSNFDSDCLGEVDEPGGQDKREDCQTVCEGSIVDYSTPFVSGNSYEWTVIGLYQGIANEFTSTASVTWDLPGSAFVIITETTPEGCEWSDTVCITIVDKPTSSFEVNVGDDTFYSISGSSATGANTINTCLNSELCFTETAVGEVNWFWDFGDGVSSVAQNPCHQFDMPGVHEVLLIVANECGCADTSIIIVDVENQLGPDITCKNVLCEESEFTYDAVLPAAPCVGAVFTWTVSGNGVITGQTGVVTGSTFQSVTGSNITSIDVNWSSGPTGSISLSITGCPDICDQVVSIEIPIIPSTMPIEGDSVLCQLESGYFNVPCMPGTDYTWTVNGNVQPDKGHDMWYTFYSPGTYTIEVTYENSFLGCDGGSDLFKVYVLPETYLFGPSVVCEGQSITFNSASGTMYSWDILDNTGALVSSVVSVETYAIPTTLPAGNYTIVATDNSVPAVYCNVPIASFEVIELPAAPNPPAGETEVCNGEVYVYTASPSLGDHYLEWEVLNGGLTTNYAGNSITVTWSAGPKSITLVQYSTSGNCPSAPVVVTITDKPAPTGLMILGNDTVCGNTPVISPELYISNIPLDGYAWSISPAIAGSIIDGNGTDTISVIWNNYDGVATISLSPIQCGDTLPAETYDVLVVPFLDLDIAGPDTICQDALSNWTASFVSGGGTGFAWDIKNPLDGSIISSGTSSSASYDFPDTSGSFVLVFYAFGPNCAVQSIENHTILVHPQPEANLSFTGEKNCVTSGTGVDFFLSVSGAAPYTYDWYQGATLITTGVTTYSVPPTVGSVGSYTVNIVDANGCSNTTNAVKVFDNCTSVPCTPPAGDVSFTYVVDVDCQTVLFTSAFTGDTPSGYIWDFASLANSTNANPSFTFPGPGNYTVELEGTYGPDTCNSYFTFDVVVPVMSNYELNIACVGNTHQINLINTTDVVNGPLSMWNHNWSLNTIPGGALAASSTAQDYLTVTGLTPGDDYVLTLSEALTYTFGSQTINGNCVITDTISIPETVVADFALPATVCEDLSLPFNDLSVGSIATWEWDFGDGSSILADNTEKTYVDPGTYNVELLVGDEFGCIDSITLSITIQPNNLSGTLAVSPVQPMCPSTIATVDFTNTTSPSSAPYVYFWSSGATGTSVTTDQTSTHSVTVSDNYGCTQVFGPVTVEVLNIPQPVIEGEFELCPNDLLSLSANYGSSFDYAWQANSNGAGWVSQGTNSPYLNSFTGLPMGTHQFVVEISDGACSQFSDTVTVIAHGIIGWPMITPSVMPACPDTTLELTVSNAGLFTHFAWSTGATGPSVFVTHSGTYQVEGTDTNGCKTSSQYAIPEMPDFCGFMCGCYSDCIDQGDTYSFPAGVYGSFTYWAWEEYIGGSWTVVASGSGVVPDYTTTSAGVHSIRLYVENAFGCGDYSCETDLTLEWCPHTDCEINAGIKDVACKITIKDEVLYTFNLSMGFAAFGEQCDQYQVTVDAPFGTISGFPVMTTSGTFVFPGTWNTHMSYYPGGVVCFDIEVLNTCDSSLCVYEACFQVDPCGIESEPCEGKIGMLEVSCKASFEVNATYYFELAVNVVPFGDPCGVYYLDITTPSGSISAISTVTLAPGSNTITGLWDTGLPSFGPDVACFTVKITNGCGDEVNFCESEICFEVPQCAGGITSTGELIVDANSVSIYPNPANDAIHVQLAVAGDYEISIVNARGMIVNRYAVAADGYGSQQIDTHDLPDGAYMIQCIGQETTVSKMLLIQHK